MNSNEEILITLATLEHQLLEREQLINKHGWYIDSFCGIINDLIEKIKELENKFKMRSDRLEDIEQAIANLESEAETLYCFATGFSQDLMRIKDRLKNDDEDIS